MFKRLKEKITEEVSKSPLRLQTVQTQIGQYSPFNGAAKKPSDSQGSSESDAPTQNDGQNLIDLQENSSSIMDISESQQFSIADEDGASSATTSPIPQPQFQKFENVELTANVSALAGSSGRPRTSSVSSTGSQPSFFPVYSPMQSSYSIQSDLESTSEMEDAAVNLDIVSKEQLYQAFQKAKAKYARYKARYGDAVKAYREQVNEKEKIKTILTESQDKALRRISELREQSQLEQKAKAHLEDNFRVTLEEKDELLRVLQTQIRLLKNGEDASEKRDNDDTQNHLIDIADSVKSENEDNSEENAKLKLKTYEETIVKLKSLLKNCKDTIVKHRENNVRLAADKDRLTEKLNEANAQLKHFMEEKSEKDRDLLNELMQASQTIENIKTKEAENALSMAETKRSMHEEMEGKEKKLQDLKVELQQMYIDNDELQNAVEEKCKENLEIELKCKNEVESAKQRLEEAEKMLEDEKQNLLQELSRGKAAAIQLMQQEADKRLKEMEDEKSAALRSLELEWQAKVREKVNEEVENLVKQDALESIATLKREVHEKEAQLKHLVEEKTLFQEQIQEQCGRQAALESEIAQMTLEKQALQEVFGRLQRVPGTHPLLAFKEVVSAQLNELRNWLVKARLDFSDHIGTSTEQFSEMNSEILKLARAHDSQLEPLMGTIESLKLENENHAKDSEASRQELDRLEEALAGSSAALEQLRARSSASEAELKAAEERLAAATEQLRHLEREREDELQELACLKLLRDDLDTLNVRCERSAGEIATLRADLLARDARVSDLEAVLGNMAETEFDCAKNEAEILRSEVDSLREQLSTGQAEHGRHVGVLSGEVEAKQLELQRLEALLGRDDLEDLRQTCADLEEERNDLRARLVERNAVLQQLEVEKGDLGTKLVGNVTLLQQLEADKAGLSASLGEKDAVLQRLEEEKNDLSATLAENATLLQRLEMEKSDLSASLGEQDALAAQFQEERNDWDGRLAENGALLRRFESENTELGAKLAESAVLLQQLEEERNDSRAQSLETTALAQRLEAELTASRSSEEALEKLKLDLEKCRGELTEKLEAALGDAAQKAAQAELLEGERSRLGELVSSLEARTLALSQEKESLEKADRKRSKANASQGQAVHELEEKLNLVKAKLREEERRHAEELQIVDSSQKHHLNELVQRLDAAGEVHAEELARQEQKLADEENASAWLRITVEDLETKVRDGEYAYAALSGQNAAKLKAATEKFAELGELAKAENDRLKHSLEEAAENYHSVDSERRSCAQEIVYLKARISVVQGELESRVREGDQLRCEASLAREDKARLLEATEGTASDCQKLQDALNEALAQKEALENELRARINQLQAEAALKEAEVAELQARKAGLAQQMLDAREEHEMQMQQSLQRVNEENQSKLADLRKRAENKLAQIKKQLVYDADKARDELQAKIASLEEQKGRDDETYSEKLAKERDNVRLEFQDKIEQLEQSLGELKAALDNERASSCEEKETLMAELTLKNAQIDESLLNAQNSYAEMSQRISGLQGQLEQAEAGLRASENELAEKKELVQLLEAQLQAEGESKTSLNEDNRLRREHAVHLHEIQNSFGEKELSFEMALEEKEGIIQAKTAQLESCSQAYEEKMDVMKTEHQRQMQELEKKWKAMLRKELKQQAAMHEEDVNGLTQEWQLERKFAPGIDYNSVAQIEVVQEELQQQTQLASSAIESGGQSSELLRRQIMTMQTQMEMLKDRHKAEVSELHQILQASNCPVPSGKSAVKGIFKDRPALQSLEIEYLKNILFEYMMGRETLTLAKVIATVVQFSDEQLNKILEKEESRGGGVSGQLGQIWK